MKHKQKVIMLITIDYVIIPMTLLNWMVDGKTLDDGL